MKTILILLLAAMIPAASFALADTLPNESTFRTAKEKVIEIEKRLEEAETKAKEAKKKDEKIKKEFDKAEKAFENAPDAKSRKEALPTFSRLTEEHGQAIDNALLAQEEVRQLELGLKEARSELENIRTKMSWAKSRIRKK